MARRIEPGKRKLDSQSLEGKIKLKTEQQPPEFYHITTPPEWQAAQAAGCYTTGSLVAEGFIHCSYRQQVLASALKHFQGQPILIVLCISAGRLKSEVRIERGAGSLQDFPHIYGPINLDAVTRVIPFDPAQPGEFAQA